MESSYISDIKYHSLPRPSVTYTTEEMYHGMDSESGGGIFRPWRVRLPHPQMWFLRQIGKWWRGNFRSWTVRLHHPQMWFLHQIGKWWRGNFRPRRVRLIHPQLWFLRQIGKWWRGNSIQWRVCLKWHLLPFYPSGVSDFQNWLQCDMMYRDKTWLANYV